MHTCTLYFAVTIDDCTLRKITSTRLFWRHLLLAWKRWHSTHVPGRGMSMSKRVNASSVRSLKNVRSRQKRVLRNTAPGSGVAWPRHSRRTIRCPMPDHPPCQIIPHPLAQSASAPGSRKIFYDSLSSTLRLAALIEWETEIRQAGEAVFNLENLENDENNALRFSHGFAVDFETLK